MYEYFLRQLSRDNTVKAARLKPLSLRASRGKYGGSLSFSINADDTRVQSIAPLDVFQVYIRNRELGIVDNDGLNNGFVLWDEYLLWGYSLSDDPRGVTTWTASAKNKWSAFDLRRVLFNEGVVDRTEFVGVAVETIGKTIVQYNCTADASIANSRFREGDLAGMGFTITVASDQARGAVIERRMRGGKVLGILADISKGSGGEFRLTRTGFLTYELDFGVPYQGEERDNVIFSVARKTMANARYEYSLAGIETVGVGVGQRDGNGRVPSNVIESAFYQADLDIEAYYDLQSINESASLDTEVEARLYQNRPKETLAFDVIQTTDTFCSPVAVSNRNTYDVGDRCIAIYAGRQIQVEVNSVSFQADDSGGSVQVGVSQVSEEEDVVI